MLFWSSKAQMIFGTPLTKTTSQLVVWIVRKYPWKKIIWLTKFRYFRDKIVKFSGNEDPEKCSKFSGSVRTLELRNIIVSSSKMGGPQFYKRGDKFSFGGIIVFLWPCKLLSEMNFFQKISNFCATFYRFFTLNLHNFLALSFVI